MQLIRLIRSTAFPCPLIFLSGRARVDMGMLLVLQWLGDAYGFTCFHATTPHVPYWLQYAAPYPVRSPPILPIQVGTSTPSTVYNLPTTPNDIQIQSASFSHFSQFQYLSMSYPANWSVTL